FVFVSTAPSTPDIYTLSLHDALPICLEAAAGMESAVRAAGAVPALIGVLDGQLRVGLTAEELRRLAASPGVAKVNSGNLASTARSEEHTSELQSRGHLVCRLLLEKKK